jgi:eukaryotic-like serine/threonine-protein kinase
MIGTQIGKFTITRKLGEGGMGAVYLAHHQVLGTSWVVKTLLPQWTSDATMVQRFINEAKAASAIKHGSIIEVADCNQLPDGTWYIVMQHLDGGTLEGFLASQGGPISPHLALRILAPMAAGLEAAHDLGIVHCDLKPENVYLIRKGPNPNHPVVLDFGIARITHQTSGVSTEVGMIAGTLAYMAPEQIYDRRKVDRRSDVYALGVIAYRMVTGWLPFQRTDAPGAFYDLSHTAIYELQKTTIPIDPRQRGASVSDRFASAVIAALQFDPARRPASARAFALLLAEATEGDAFEAGGLEIVRELAPELLTIGNLTETVRNPRRRAAAEGERYQLGEKIAEGGMAEVFRATAVGAEGFARAVAIKRILPGFSNLPRFAQMFVQEAQIAALLAHPNIVTVIDFARDADDRLFLVLEFVDGVDLDRLVASGPLPLPVAIFIIGEVLAALGYAHNLPTLGTVRGVVHRDVSPHNVLISREAAVKLSDFGLAKAREATEASASEVLKGKPAYMSPEQVNGSPLDGRSDLFAIGVIFWEVLTGERLFWKDDARTTIARVLQRPIPRPSVIRPVPADLEAVVMRLLARDVDARYANAGDALDDLGRCANASIRGRSDLAKLIAERFPLTAAPATSETAPAAAGSGPAMAAPTGGAERARMPSATTAPLGAPAPPPAQPRVTSISVAASERIAPRTTVTRRRGVPTLAVGATVAVVGAVLAFAAVRSGHPSAAPAEHGDPAASRAPSGPPRAPPPSAAGEHANAAAPVAPAVAAPPPLMSVPDAGVDATPAQPAADTIAPGRTAEPVAPNANSRRGQRATDAPNTAPTKSLRAPAVRPRDNAEDVGGD